MQPDKERELFQRILCSSIEFGKVVDFSCTIGELLCVVANLQLAFRHPQNRGASLVIAQGAAKRMIGVIARGTDDQNDLMSLLNLRDEFPGMGAEND